MLRPNSGAGCAHGVSVAAALERVPISLSLCVGGMFIYVILLSGLGEGTGGLVGRPYGACFGGHDRIIPTQGSGRSEGHNLRGDE